MKILVTNDDGYQAQGIKYLAEFLDSSEHEYYIVAPSKEKSAASSSLTIRATINMNKINEKTFSVDGTPVDCLKLGLSICTDTYPDLVISGINLGPNLGTDTLYSGTVGAAMDGAVLGFRAVALSTNREFIEKGPGKDFDKYLKKALDIAMTVNLPKHTMLNINIPRSDIKGIKLVPIGMVIYRGGYKKAPGKENAYYLDGIRNEMFNLENEVDDRYFFENYMTITPLRYDMTDYDYMYQLEKEIDNIT